MANVQLYAGLALIIFGLGSLAVFPLPPLSVLNSTQIQNLSVACDASNNCTGSATIRNINVTVPLTIWYAVLNPSNQQVFIGTDSNTISVGQSVKTSLALSQLPTSSGLQGLSAAYTLNMIVTTETGTQVAYQASTTFSPSPELVLLPAPSCNTTACASVATPKGMSVACPSNVNILYPNAYCAVYAQNTVVTLTNPSVSNSNFQIDCTWIGLGYGSGNYCPAQQGTLILSGGTLKLDRSYAVTTLTGSAVQSQTSMQIIPDGPVGGTWSPSSPTTIYAPNAGSPQSATFTFNMLKNTSYVGYKLKSWQLVAACSPTSSGGVSQLIAQSANLSFTASWALISSFASNNCPYANIKTTVATATFNSLQIFGSANDLNGATTNPPYGTYYYADNPHSQTVTVSVNSGHCFLGWIYNGQKMGNNPSITVSVTAPSALLADTAPSASLSCTTGGGSGGGGNQNYTGLMIAIPSFLLGSVLVAKSRKR